MTRIREQEDALLEEWHSSRKKENRGKAVNFVADGMVDEAGYTASKPKIAYVLKEYAPEGQGHDLRNDLSRGVGYWWWKVAYMTHNIRHLPSAPEAPVPWDDAWLIKMHKSVCAFNLSKIGGNSYTDMKMLALQAMKRREFIQRQFELYDPDITICSGTFDIFRYALMHDEKEVNESKGKEIWWYEREHGKYVISTYHFSYPAFGYKSINKVVAAIGKSCVQK